MACSTVPSPVTGVSGGAGDPSFQAQVNDFNQTVAEGAVAGAVIGGLIGAVRGKGDLRDIVTGAAAGGIVGGLAGYAIAGQKANFASKEQAIAGMTDDAKNRVTKLAGLVNSADRLVAQRQQEVIALRKAVASAQVQAERKNVLLSQIKADQAAIETAMKAAETHSSALAGNITQFNQQYPGQTPGSVPALAADFEMKKSELNLRAQRMGALAKELEK